MKEYGNTLWDPDILKKQKEWVDLMKLATDLGLPTDPENVVLNQDACVRSTCTPTPHSTTKSEPTSPVRGIARTSPSLLSSLQRPSSQKEDCPEDKRSSQLRLGQGTAVRKLDELPPSC